MPFFSFGKIIAIKATGSEIRAVSKSEYDGMVKKKGRSPTSGEEMATALDRWDEEGGAQDVAWPLPYEASDLGDVERRVLECPGAALVSEWNDLPTGVQRRLFEHAALGKSRDAALLKKRIARSCTIIKALRVPDSLFDPLCPNSLPRVSK
jgi:hypothetical protein